MFILNVSDLAVQYVLEVTAALLNFFMVMFRLWQNLAEVRKKII